MRWLGYGLVAATLCLVVGAVEHQTSEVLQLSDDPSTHTAESWAKGALKQSLAEKKARADAAAEHRKAQEVAYMLAKEESRLAGQEVAEKAREKHESLAEALDESTARVALKTVGAFAVIRPKPVVTPTPPGGTALLEVGEDKVAATFRRAGE